MKEGKIREMRKGEKVDRETERERERETESRVFNLFCFGVV